MSEIQTLLGYLTPISLTIGVIYYVLTLRNTRRNQQLQLETRQAQLFVQMYNRFTSYEFKTKWNEVMHVWEWEDLADFNAKYGLGTEEFPKMDLVSTFFEGVGVMVKRGLIDVSLVDDLMSGHVVSGWERFVPMIKSWREMGNWPQLLEWWEYLYYEVKRIMDGQHPEIVEKEIGRLSFE